MKKKRANRLHIALLLLLAISNAAYCQMQREQDGNSLQPPAAKAQRTAELTRQEIYSNNSKITTQDLSAYPSAADNIVTWIDDPAERETADRVKRRFNHPAHFLHIPDPNPQRKKFIKFEEKKGKNSKVVRKPICGCLSYPRDRNHSCHVFFQ